MYFSPTIKIITTDTKCENTLNVLKDFNCKKELLDNIHNLCINDFISEEYMLIVEDDITDELFRPTMSIYKIIDNAPQNWDIIVLSIECDLPTYNTLLNYPSDYILHMNINNINKNLYGTKKAYIINKKGVSKLNTSYSNYNTYIYKYPIFTSETGSMQLKQYILSKVNNSYRPFFSIILPVYNGMNYIGHAIESVLTQEFTDFELIIVNDGSTDDTKKYLDNLNNKKLYIIHQTNQRTANAINNGIKRSVGSYITWTSHDNILKHNFLSEYYNVLNMNKEVHFMYGGTIFFGTDNWNSNPGLLNPRELFFAYPGIASFMWRRDTVCKVGDFNADLHGIEDLDYVWRTIEYNSKIYSLKKLLYMFRMHNQQASYELSATNKWYGLNRKMLTLFVERNTNNFQISSFYPYINECKNINRAYCIAYYELAMKIISDNRAVYREILHPFALMCLEKSYTYDNTFKDAINLFNMLNNNKNVLHKQLIITDITNEELFIVEKEHMKLHEYS
ncbi:MAG: hypothetical protein Homavirus26_3 [Homavirus sp.]|uniref:Glycosyltransferase 2-like domain-containing protein n=1 Tax=Homavirus sp. TaxID=2487769 RepID=A0A3G5A4X3_9VIRU|nr:MAG: hypothetical protein Homavirus26_3 [Homavirus sp.]